MSLRDVLLTQLSEISLLDDRYQNISCVNYNPKTPDEKTGTFSLVFKAHDIVEDKAVAIKFFDPDCLGLSYRLRAFDREPEILRRIKSKARCLQIQSPLKAFPIKMRVEGHKEVSVPCNYFVTEWLEDEVESIFETQQDFDAIVKLQLARQITLAVAALHRYGIFHRDVKKENARSTENEGESVVKIIDMGAAACYEHPPILESYEDAAGDLRYSSPEALCGLCSIRDLGKTTDFYAIGCLLYELFNYHIYFASFKKNPNNMKASLMAAQSLQGKRKDSDKLEAWHKAMDIFQHAFQLPGLDEKLSTAPISILTPLEALIHQLVCVDYRKRLADTDRIIQKIDSMINTLQDIRRQKIEKKRREEWKRRKLAKLAEKENRNVELLEPSRTVRNV